VTLARSGREALDRVIEQHPDLIVLNAQLPDLAGAALIRQLRAVPALSATPIIALTSLSIPGDREQCLESGANVYLRKPVQPQIMAGLIEQLVSR
ncbi:MAG: response regulator, partial [Oscillochloris sp.]|nr:response regulator [Oscillochloris sp.]